jgi:secreted trypsin-like serine protease
MNIKASIFAISISSVLASPPVFAAETPKSRVGSKPLLAVLDQNRGVGGERITFGEPVRLDENPWQVAIVAAEIADNYAAQFCGGSTIGERWVLTAAHCVDNGTAPTMIRVLRGTADLTTGGQRWEVEKIVVHSDWNPKNYDSDIALLRLSNPVPREALIALWAAELPAPAAGSLVRVSGWGRTAENSPRSKLLVGVEVPLQPLDLCNEPDAYKGAVTKNMICAGKVKGGADSCKGDSGGPATAESSGRRRQIGIVSWGIGCGRPKRYGVYTDVARFETWIRSNLD